MATEAQQQLLKSLSETSREQTRALTVMISETSGVRFDDIQAKVRAAKIAHNEKVNTGANRRFRSQAIPSLKKPN